MLNLTVQHHIHLNKEQRYAIHAGEELVVTGVSVPVWYLNKVTSEPAKEVFCRYYIKNDKEDTPVLVQKDGFEITLPYREGKGLNITDEEWRELSLNNPEKLELMYANCVQEVSSKNLLDLIDGGSKHMAYKEYNKIEQEKRTLKIMHFVQLDDIEKLLRSTI